VTKKGVSYSYVIQPRLEFFLAPGVMAGLLVGIFISLIKEYLRLF